MRRRLLTVTVFLLAGAVVNVAVAWGCALWSPMEPVTDPGRFGPLPRIRPATSFEQRRLVEYGVQVPKNWAPPFESVGSGFGTKVTSFTSGDWKGPHVQVFAAGWPLRALSAMNRIMGGMSSGPRPGIPLVPVGKNRGLGVLPLRPDWPGFAVNTIFYATLLWLLICGPFVLRRFIRVKRGHCVKCGYPRGESAVCSECGRALPGCARVTT